MVPGARRDLEAGLPAGFDVLLMPRCVVIVTACTSICNNANTLPQGRTTCARARGERQAYMF